MRNCAEVGNWMKCGYVSEVLFKSRSNFNSTATLSLALQSI